MRPGQSDESVARGRRGRPITLRLVGQFSVPCPYVKVSLGKTPNLILVVQLSSVRSVKWTINRFTMSLEDLDQNLSQMIVKFTEGQLNSWDKD